VNSDHLPEVLVLDDIGNVEDMRREVA